MGTLTLVAERTGKPFSFFLPRLGRGTARREGELRAVLDHLADRRDFEEVMKIARPLLGKVSPWPTGTALQLHLGRALLRLHRPLEALPYLRQARDAYSLRGQSRALAESSSLEGHALYRIEDPLAGPVLDSAYRVAETLVPRSPELEAQILTSLGSVHSSHHNWKDAVDTYEAAIRLGSHALDLAMMARLYNNIAFAYAELGEWPRALRHARKSLALRQAGQDKVGMAISHNNLGRMLLHSGDSAGAHQHLSAALQMCGDLQLESGRAHVLLSLSEYEAAYGDSAKAMALVNEGIELATRLDEQLTLAEGLQQRGELRDAAGQRRQADLEFSRAFAILERANATDRLIEARARRAQMLVVRGSHAEASEQYRLALGLTHPRVVRTSVDLRRRAG
jgi:tetratricopeptide (TPR) repeat protein